MIKSLERWRANTNVKGLGGQGPNSTTSPGTAKTVAGGILPPGYTAYVDNLLTSTVAIVYDPDAFVWVQGPTGTAQDQRRPTHGRWLHRV